MANQYHDPYTGKFCSKGEMGSLIQTALRDGDYEKYETYSKIVEKAEKAKQRSILAGFKAVKDNDTKKLQKIITEQLDKTTDQYEESQILAGLSKNASPQVLDSLLTNKAFTSSDFMEAYSKFSPEEQTDFIRNSKNIRASHIESILLEVKLSRTHDYTKLDALYSREDLTATHANIARRTYMSNKSYVLSRFEERFKNNPNASWPFSDKDTQEELSYVDVGYYQPKETPSIKLVAERSRNPKVLATIGSSVPDSVDAVLANPHTDGKAIATILHNSTFLTSDQTDKLASALKAKSDVPDEIKEKLNNLNVSSATVITPKQEKELLSKVRNPHGLKKQIELLETHQGLTPEQKETRLTAAKEAHARLQAEYENARAVLDSTERNYNSLVKQKANLTQGVNRYNQVLTKNKSYQNVVKRLENADKQRNATGGLELLKKELKGFSYNIMKIEPRRSSF
jgi:hypothetical protein